MQSMNTDKSQSSTISIFLASSIIETMSLHLFKDIMASTSNARTALYFLVQSNCSVSVSGLFARYEWIRVQKLCEELLRLR